ncbi:hypothetical protein Pve01_83640 [Planomonospora venezuelensis]|nr:hypothetical protein Pve01_83640 [Planomonospora venezuelensis]
MDNVITLYSETPADVRPAEHVTARTHAGVTTTLEGAPAEVAAAIRRAISDA